MTRRREVLRLIGTGAVPLVAGCTGDGGGGDTTPESTPSPTVAEDETPSPTDSPTDTPTESPTPTDSPTPTPTPGSIAAEITLRNNFFSPVRAEVEPGSTVRWTNEASGTYADHTVTSAQFHDNAADWRFDERLDSDETVTYTFDSGGIYEYYCTIHGKGTMCGVVLVGDVSLDKSLPCE